jgi:hypothetical protein
VDADYVAALVRDQASDLDRNVIHQCWSTFCRKHSIAGVGPQIGAALPRKNVRLSNDGRHAQVAGLPPRLHRSVGGVTGPQNGGPLPPPNDQRSFGKAFKLLDHRGIAHCRKARIEILFVHTADVSSEMSKGRFPRCVEGDLAA